MRWLLTVVCFIGFGLGATAQEKPPSMIVDKERKTITITCTVAPRKLPNLDQIYPIEVIATYPAPQGQKAHETVVCFTGVKPSDVHKALESLGLKPGKPARGEGARASGPEVSLSLLLPTADGSTKEVPIEKTLVDRKTGKPLPPLKWHFTGSVMKQPDPEKPDMVYGADFTGTLIAIFPVTDEVVIQSQLTMKEEPLIKLEVNRSGENAVPSEGTPVKLVIKVK
ncbi:MAG: YdjY domain-containing protein [Gemmatales bacterium]|nr:YdjY domain-containing protein [Gemmatales bacterium]MDW8387303.1 YdjY domain-containing protein [Gemmatales bacterium]